MSIEFDFVDLTVKGELERAITPNTKMVWIETPTNPTLKVSDIKSLSDVARSNNLIVVVDNTFMSPFLQVLDCMQCFVCEAE